MVNNDIYDSYVPQNIEWDSQQSFFGYRSSASSEIREPRNNARFNRYTNRHRQRSNLRPSEELDDLIIETLNKPYKKVPFDRYESPSGHRKPFNNSNKSVVGCSYPHHSIHHRRGLTPPHQYSHLSKIFDSTFSDVPNQDRNFESNSIFSRQERDSSYPYNNIHEENVGVNEYNSLDQHDRSSNGSYIYGNRDRHDHHEPDPLFENYKHSHESYKRNQIPILTKASQVLKSKSAPTVSSPNTSKLSNRLSTLSKFRKPYRMSERTEDSIASTIPNDRTFFLQKNQPKSEASLAATAAAYLLSSDERNLYNFDSAVRSVSNLLDENSRTFSQKIKATSSEEYEENDTYFPVSFLKMQESVRHDMTNNSAAKNPGKSFHISAYKFWAEITLLILLEVLKVYPQNQEMTHMVADAVINYGVSTIQNNWLKSGEDDIMWVASKVAEKILSSTEGSEKIALTIIVILLKEGNKVLQKERVLNHIDDCTFQEKIRHSIHSNDMLSKRAALIIQEAKMNILRNKSHVSNVKSLNNSESRANKLRRMRNEKEEKFKRYFARTNPEKEKEGSVIETFQNTENRSRGNPLSDAEIKRRLRTEKVKKSKAYIDKMNKEMKSANTVHSAAIQDASSVGTNQPLQREMSSSNSNIVEANEEFKQPRQHNRMMRAERFLKTKAKNAMKSDRGENGVVSEKSTDIDSTKNGTESEKSADIDWEKKSIESGNRQSPVNLISYEHEAENVERSNSSENIESTKVDELSGSSSNHRKTVSSPKLQFPINHVTSESSADDTSQIRDQVIRIQMRAAQNDIGISQDEVQVLTPKQIDVENDHIKKVSFLNKKNEKSVGSGHWLSCHLDRCCGLSNYEDDSEKKKIGQTNRNYFSSVPNKNDDYDDHTWSSDFSGNPSSFEQQHRMALDVTSFDEDAATRGSF